MPALHQVALLPIHGWRVNRNPLPGQLHQIVKEFPRVRSKKSHTLNRQIRTDVVRHVGPKKVWPFVRIDDLHVVRIRFHDLRLAAIVYARNSEDAIVIHGHGKFVFQRIIDAINKR